MSLLRSEVVDFENESTSTHLTWILQPTTGLVEGLSEIFKLCVLHVVFLHIFKVCGPNLNFSRCRNFLGDVITPKSGNSQKSNFQPFLSRFDAYTSIICPLLSCIVA